MADPTDARVARELRRARDAVRSLRSTAIDREVLVAVANSAAPGIFDFVASVEKLGVRNFIVVALDDALHAKLGARGVASYRVRNDAVGSHKVSAQKFSIVNEFVERGCSVLLTDTDVAYLRNPFPFLFRDSDVESMSDGWDAGSAFGFLETVDDASLGREKNSGRRRAKTFRVAALNSGMWLVMATRASARLMTTMARRMATEPNLWDQSGYNLELWFASRDDVRVSGATVRVLHPLCFVNSKVMFRFIRHAPSLRKEAHTPVAMHSNYHTDKAFKMQRVVEYYTKAEATADVLNRGRRGVRREPAVGGAARARRQGERQRRDRGVEERTEGGGRLGGERRRRESGGNADPSHCKPRTPLANSGRVAAYAPHAVPGNRGDFCARLHSQSREVTDAIARDVRGALRTLRKRKRKRKRNLRRRGGRRRRARFRGVGRAGERRDTTAGAGEPDCFRYERRGARARGDEHARHQGDGGSGASRDDTQTGGRDDERGDSKPTDHFVDGGDEVVRRDRRARRRSTCFPAGPARSALRRSHLLSARRRGRRGGLGRVGTTPPPTATTTSWTTPRWTGPASATAAEWWGTIPASRSWRRPKRRYAWRG